MEATYCVGSDVDVCRMFDQYLYKRSENVDLSLSIPNSNFPHNGYNMGDQTFHTPSFGDEEFDIPAINPQQQQQQQQQQHAAMYQPPPMGMSLSHQQQDALGMHDPTGGYQQPLYLSGPDHGMVNPSYHSPQTNYSHSLSPTQQQQQQHQQHNTQLLMIQQQQAAAAHQQQQAQQHHQQQMMMGHPQQPPYGTSPQHPQSRGNTSPPVVPGQEPTTSEDSDDSTPHPAMLTGGMKRPSPEPAESIAKVQKKPKVQKKKKKRDPNEPQKPVSAYALFFRDTQAAIKGQNPNASFGEVSKIVASMWDALDSEHKNVYKKKTEAAKKEYLKALAAYRASLVSKGAGEGADGGMYAGYSNYGGQPPAPQYGGYSPQNALPSPPTPPSQQQSQQQPSPMGVKKQQQQQPPSMMPNMPSQQQQQHASMLQPMPGHMSMPPHMQPPPHSNNYMQQAPQQPAVQQHPLMPPARVSPPPMASSSPPVSAPAPTVPTSVPQQSQMRPANSCIRHGCPNLAVSNQEWEDEYCSNECVVSHCRDVFSTWVASNSNQSQNFSTVK